jgi:hypothetical protein
MDTQLLVERAKSLPGAVQADFAPLGGAWLVLSAEVVA